MSKKLLVSCLILFLAFNLIPLTSLANTTTLQPGTLIKASSDAVYYYGADNKRYVFPNEKTYKTWFVDFSLVITISDELLGELPIGGNVTYKPSKRLVKITTDPKVYYVDKEGVLRPLPSEALAQDIFGSNWQDLVDDLPDPFFINYKVGLPLENSLPAIETDYSINEDKTLSTEPDPTINELSSITLTGSASNGIANLNWTTSNLAADLGFKVVKSTEPDPVYPGNDYHYLTDPTIRTDSWQNLASNTYYFRVCQYLGDKCGIYSNNLVLKIGSSTVTDKKISLLALAEANKVTFRWTENFISSKGFKLVKSNQANPVYPGNDYQYLSDPNASLYEWTDLPAGTYHFRVCEYLGSSCGVYSNDVSVTILGSSTDNSNGSIILSGWHDPSVNKVFLEWDVNNMYSDMGFKIVYSTSPNPIYPGDPYHYLSDPNVRADNWAGLQPGTYHFRVCEYLGGACGIYSNDIQITVQ